MRALIHSNSTLLAIHCFVPPSFRIIELEKQRTALEEQRAALEVQRAAIEKKHLQAETQKTQVEQKLVNQKQVKMGALHVIHTLYSTRLVILVTVYGYLA